MFAKTIAAAALAVFLATPAALAQYASPGPTAVEQYASPYGAPQRDLPQHGGVGDTKGW